MLDRREPPDLRRRVQPDHLDRRPVDRDRRARARCAKPAAIMRDLAHRDQAPLAAPESASTTASSHAPCEREPTWRSTLRVRGRCSSAHELDRLDVVAVVAELVEHADAVDVAPRLRDDDEIGVEVAHDVRDIETHTVEPAEPADPPVRVERRDGEVAMQAEFRCRCVGQAARGGTWGHRGRSRSSSRA